MNWVAVRNRWVRDMMRSISMRAFCLIIFLGAVPSASAKNKESGESPLQVTTCQLENHPSAYDHKLVEVRGRVYFGKFDFVIDSICKPHGQIRVWLDLGGDVQAPGKAANLSNLGDKLKVLAEAAKNAGTKALAYFEKGTPDSVLNVARKQLGKDNVHIFEMRKPH